MGKEIRLDRWWKRWIYYFGWIMLAVLSIGFVRGLIDGFKAIT